MGRPAGSQWSSFTSTYGSGHVGAGLDEAFTMQSWRQPVAQTSPNPVSRCDERTGSLESLSLGAGTRRLFERTLFSKPAQGSPAQSSLRPAARPARRLRGQH